LLAIEHGSGGAAGRVRHSHNPKSQTLQRWLEAQLADELIQRRIPGKLAAIVGADADRLGRQTHARPAEAQRTAERQLRIRPFLLPVHPGGYALLGVSGRQPTTESEMIGRGEQQRLTLRPAL